MWSSVLLVWLMAVGVTSAPDYCTISSCPTPSSHTMCQHPTAGAAASCPAVTERGVSSDERDQILRAHNTIRRDVSSGVYRDMSLPAARDMPDLSWDDELAAVAQRWADQCRQLDNDQCRDVSRFPVGQSITTTEGPSTNSKNWTHTVANVWFHQALPEFKKEQKDLTCCSAFTAFRLTQLIWADTNKIGCGFIGVKSANSYPVERTVRTYICNYGPAGNRLGSEVYRKKRPRPNATNVA